MNHKIDETAHVIFSIERMDEARLNELMAFDPEGDLLTQLIQLFDLEIATSTKQISSQFEKKNFKDLSQLAHKFRSTSLNLAATRLSEVLKRIEYGALKDEVNHDELNLLIGLMFNESLMASQYLHAYIKKINPVSR